MSNLLPASEVPDTATRLYRTVEGARDELVAFLSNDGTIYRMRGTQAQPVGRADAEDRILRTTAFGERELGQALPSGEIVSAGLFVGGATGWLDPDGVVIRAGLILGEEEVGRVAGPHARAAAAALLLLILPDESEANRRHLR